MSAASPAPFDANHSSILSLSFHDTLSAWPAGAAPTVRVIRGVAWATQEGDRRDHVLRVGQEVVLSRHGRVVVQAIHRDGTEIQLDDLHTA